MDDNQLKQIVRMFQSFVQVMSAAIDERTPYNAAHTRNMVACGRRFLDYINKQDEKAGRACHFDAKRREKILMSLWLHDLGKLITPLEVMNKDTRLTREEQTDISYRFRLMKQQLRIRQLEGELDDTQLTREFRRIEEAKELISKVNPAGSLTEELLQQIDALAHATYVDEEGEVKTWLTCEEWKRLSIERGTLTEEERTIMEDHVSATARLLSQIDFGKTFEEVPRWASRHHEFLDGTGYPEHLRGDEIEPEVRIITILDIFDALTADDRPYKPGISVTEALDILINMADHEGKLDPELTRDFIRSECWKQ